MCLMRLLRQRGGGAFRSNRMSGKLFLLLNKRLLNFMMRSLYSWLLRGYIHNLCGQRHFGLDFTFNDGGAFHSALLAALFQGLQ
jgi:hypothetical protein